MSDDKVVPFDVLGGGKKPPGEERTLEEMFARAKAAEVWDVVIVGRSSADGSLYIDSQGGVICMDIAELMRAVTVLCQRRPY